MNRSKQQIQVLLVLRTAKSQNKFLKLTQIIYHVDTILYNAHQEPIGRHPQRRAPDKEYVSFTRTLKRLWEEGYVRHDDRFYELTNKGLEKVKEIEQEIKKLRDDLAELELFLHPS